LTGTTGSKHVVLGRLSLAFKWQNTQREANSSLCKLVIIQFCDEFCTLVLWPYALQRVKFSIGKNVLPEAGDSTFFRNLGTWLHGVFIQKLVYSINLNVNLMNCVFNFYVHILRLGLRYIFSKRTQMFTCCMKNGEGCTVYYRFTYRSYKFRHYRGYRLEMDTFCRFTADRCLGAASNLPENLHKQMLLYHTTCQEPLQMKLMTSSFHKFVRQPR